MEKLLLIGAMLTGLVAGASSQDLNGPTAPAMAPRPPSTEPCGDLAATDLCEEWSLVGRCVSDSPWMRGMCKRTCGICGENANRPLPDACVDYSTRCGATVAKYSNPCQAYRLTMLWRCPISCKACGPGIECRNWDSLCPIYARIDECRTNKIWMDRYCPRACGLCRSDQATECRNYLDDGECDSWANTGECSRNPGYMLYECPKACRICGTHEVCQDRINGCEELVAQGLCTSNPSLMEFSCRSACGLCRDTSGNTATCKDYEFNCEIWKSWGECTKNRAYMDIHCQRTCGLCRTV